jgi:hypothetical protein
MPAQLTELKVRDVAIKLHRAGRGPTVLFLHGAGGVERTELREFGDQGAGNGFSNAIAIARGA